MGEFTISGHEKGEARLADHLALDRTQLANERTLLAYLRTALMLIVSGATAIKFFGDSLAIILTGWLLIGLGVLVGSLGIGRFVAMRRSIRGRAKSAKLER